MTHRINLEPKHTIISSGNGPKSFRFDLLSAAVCHLNASDYQSTLIFDSRKLFAVDDTQIRFGVDQSTIS
jgi:hypothetical protein